MSRAFVKESDGSELDRDFPERAISPHRNLVTPDGLAQIVEALRESREAVSAARAAVDSAALARAERDLLYWTKRFATAEPIPYPTDTATVRFGSRVTITDADGQERTYRIVGEDEAAPTEGKLSYASPLARQLLGCEAGDVVPSAAGEVEVIAIG
jgi:transcription elongation GreA/GreB family factor